MDKFCNVIYSDSNFIVAHKSAHLPSAPLNEGDECALYAVAKQFPEVVKVHNSLKAIEGGLVHRIDTETEGLLLFARNDQSFEFMRKIQDEGKFVKGYLAVCNKEVDSSSEIYQKEGFPPCPFVLKDGEVISSKFRNFGPKHSQVRPVTENSQNKYSSKKAFDSLYETQIDSFSKMSGIQQNDEIYEIRCSIKKGFRHQVRCHLAWLGYPVVNDKVYGSKVSLSFDGSEQMKFYAVSLSFPNPDDNSEMHFDISDKVK